MIRAALVVLVATTTSALATPLRGIVSELGATTPIEGATVLTDHAAATTDVDGYFLIDVPRGDRQLTIVAAGYDVKILKLRAADFADTIHLELAPTSGGEVIEVSGKTPEQTKPLSYKLTVAEIRSIPGAGNDILRATTVLPGVARIPFSFGGLVLRGTNPRDSAVYLDGIEVPIAFHFGGLTSFYPSGMLDDLTLTAGGFDASYGRAQGGLVTLTTREPRTDRWRLGGSIGLFDSSIQAEGPLGPGGVLVGIRRSYFDAVAAPFAPDDTPLPSYLDMQIRTTFGDPRRRGRITPMIFGSIDRVANDDVAISSGFFRAAVPYHLVRTPFTLHVTPWIGANRLAFSDHEDEPHQEFSRPTLLGGVRAELTRDTSWGHVRGGAELSSGYLYQTHVNFELSDDDDTNNGSLDGSTSLAWSDLALWTEARWRLADDRLSIKPGLRAELYGLTGQLVVDPRINFHQQLAPDLALRQSVGRFHQPPTPGDVDTDGGNPDLDGSHADQFTLGIDAAFSHDITASITGFYTDLANLGVPVRSPQPGSDAPQPNLGGLGPTFQLLLEKQLGFPIYRDDIGRGTSEGIELSIKRDVGSLFTMLSYTLAMSERVDDPRAGIGRRPFELDQRHNLQLVAAKQYTKWKFGARVQFVTGNPYTPIVMNGTSTVEEPFAGRLPPFFSLDLRADRRWHRCWGDIDLFFDIQNVTNRRNVEGREVDFDRETDITGLPIIPFIGVEFLPTK